MSSSTRPKLVISEKANKTEISLEDQVKVRKYVAPNVSERLAALSASVATVQTVNTSQSASIGALENSLDLTANKALISNALGKVAVSTTSSTEIGYIAGLTSAIQTQLNAKRAITSKIYIAVISQSGTDAPTAVEFENTLGGSFTFSRVDAGEYRGTLTGAFPDGAKALFNVIPQTRVSYSSGPNRIEVRNININRFNNDIFEFKNSYLYIPDVGSPSQDYLDMNGSIFIRIDVYE